MEAARATWTDSRLDELNGRVKGIDTKMDAGFERLDKRIDTGLGRLDVRIDGTNERIDGTNERIDGTNERIDAMNHTMMQGMVALISIIAVLLTAFLAIVATHL